MRLMANGPPLAEARPRSEEITSAQYQWSETNAMLPITATTC